MNTRTKKIIKNLYKQSVVKNNESLPNFEHTLDIYKRNPEFSKKSNCYAYALRSSLAVPEYNIYSPGWVSNSKRIRIYEIGDRILIDNYLRDLKFLGFTTTISGFGIENIIMSRRLSDDNNRKRDRMKSALVSLLLSSETGQLTENDIKYNFSELAELIDRMDDYEDFHFIRKDDDGQYSHKPGWEKIPERVNPEANTYIDNGYKIIETVNFQKSVKKSHIFVPKLPK